MFGSLFLDTIFPADKGTFAKDAPASLRGFFYFTTPIKLAIVKVKFMKKILFLSALFAVLAIVPVVACGATFKIGENYYFNPGSAINDNLYAAGSNVSIAGIINGDLFTAGSNALISGPVYADLAAIAGGLNVSGKVGGDMRLLGGNINITSSDCRLDFHFYHTLRGSRQFRQLCL